MVMMAKAAETEIDVAETDVVEIDAVETEDHQGVMDLQEETGHPEIGIQSQLTKNQQKSQPRKKMRNQLQNQKLRKKEAVTNESSNQIEKRHKCQYRGKGHTETSQT